MRKWFEGWWKANLSRIEKLEKKMACYRAFQSGFFHREEFHPPKNLFEERRKRNLKAYQNG